MSGQQAIQSSKQQATVLAGVLVAHVALLLLFVIGMSPSKHATLGQKPSIQLPVPLPMAMVDMIEPPGASGSPTATLSRHYQPNPSLATMNKPDSAAKAINEPMPKSASRASTKALKTENNQQNTKALPLLVNSKTATTSTEHEANASNGTASGTAYPSASASGDGSNNKSHSGSDNGNAQANSSGAQSAGSIGPSTSPSFGAAYLNNPAPKYPSIARRNGDEGKVLLRVLVTSDGLAKQVGLYASSGVSSLDEAAITAVRKWRFVPAKRGDEAVEAWVQVPIVFKLDS